MVEKTDDLFEKSLFMRERIMNDNAIKINQ